MITIIHGDDSAPSRNFFISLKQSTDKSTSLDGPTLTLPDITQILQGGDLFKTNPPVFINEFLSKRKPSREADSIVNCLEKNTSTDIYLWESKELTSKQLNSIKNATPKS